MEAQSIVVLDFGAQYSQLIARRIREQKVFSVVLPCTASVEEIRGYSPVGIVLSGGPSSVYDQDAPAADDRVFALGLPVLTTEGYLTEPLWRESGAVAPLYSVRQSFDGREPDPLSDRQHSNGTRNPRRMR